MKIATRTTQLLISNTEIHDTIKTKYLKDVSLNSSKEALILLPKIIEIMEREYKKMLGTSKKQLVIELIVFLMKTADANESEIELVKIILPDLIDNMVGVLNSAGKLFKKQTKKCCLRVKKI